MYRLMCLAVGSSLFLAACETTTTTPVDQEWAAVLEGEGDWAHVTGVTVVVTPVGAGAFTAVAEIENDRPGAVRPWHVHVNSCAVGGGIVGADGDYPRLEVGADGRATATATVPAVLQAGASYHVNVHRSEAEMEIITACGDLGLVN